MRKGAIWVIAVEAGCISAQERGARNTIIHMKITEGAVRDKVVTVSIGPATTVMPRKDVASLVNALLRRAAVSPKRALYTSRTNARNPRSVSAMRFQTLSVPGVNHGGSTGGAPASPPSLRNALRTMSDIRRRRSGRNSSYSINSQPKGRACSAHIRPQRSSSIPSFSRRRGT